MLYQKYSTGIANHKRTFVCVEVRNSGCIQLARMYFILKFKYRESKIFLVLFLICERKRYIFWFPAPLYQKVVLEKMRVRN